MLSLPFVSFIVSVFYTMVIIIVDSEIVSSVFQNMALFKTIVKDCFAGLPDAPLGQTIGSARSRGIDIESALDNKAMDAGLIAHKPWINKCTQLYSLSQAYPGNSST